jgi:hypothetical protein
VQQRNASHEKAVADTKARGPQGEWLIHLC